MPECEFYNLTRKLLLERLELLRQNITSEFTDIRHLFYIYRNRFLREHPELNEVDSKSKSIYNDFESNVIGGFCTEHCAEFNIDPDKWWRLREKMNIWAEGRAICHHEDFGDFLITNKNRHRVDRNCSFILVCEKKQ